MLIVHPNSSCDVCLEHYGSGSKSPHSISCGHVFCLGCLESISTGVCPLCRDRFHPLETRRLHVDIDTPGQAGPPRTSSADPPSAEARRLQDSIARIVKDGSSESHLRSLIEECGTFLKTQNRCQHEDLRVSFRMISYLCDVKSSLKKQSESLAKLEVDHTSLRVRLTAELEAAERKYQELLQTSTDEKETALAVEKSLREHYKQILMRCEAAEAECERLSQGLDRKPRSGRLYPIAHQTRHKTDDVPFPTQDDIFDPTSKETISRNAEKDGLYLSPLPESIDHLPSSPSLKSFVALPEVDYEFEKLKDNDLNSKDNQRTRSPIREPGAHITEPLHFTPEHPLRSNALPLRVVTELSSVNPHAPRVSSGLSLTAPRDSDTCDQEMPTSSHPSSRRSSRHSSPSPFIPPATPQDLIPTRDSYSRDRGRSFVLGQNEPEQLRSQLHELLSNPVSSSLPNISHFPSSNTPQGSSPPLSRSASSISQRPLPVHSHGTSHPPATTYSHASSTMQRPVISHASSAALALEKERQKAEKERREAAENERQKAERDQRRQLSSAASSSPLREHPNIYASNVQHSIPRRETTNAYGTPTGLGTLRETASTHSLSRGNSSSLRDTTNAYATQLFRHQGLGNGKGRLANVQTVFS